MCRPTRWSAAWSRRGAAVARRPSSLPPPGRGGGWGGKTPALTLPQMRAVFARLLRDPPPSARQIAEEVSQVLRRNEEARIYHWHKATGDFPPQRLASDSG